MRILYHQECVFCAIFTKSSQIFFYFLLIIFRIGHLSLKNVQLGNVPRRFLLYIYITALLDVSFLDTLAC